MANELTRSTYRKYSGSAATQRGPQPHRDETKGMRESSVSSEERDTLQAQETYIVFKERSNAISGLMITYLPVYLMYRPRCFVLSDATGER